jgi:hypothetical protein
LVENGFKFILELEWVLWEDGAFGLD